MKSRIIIMTLCAIAAGTMSVFGGDWPQWRGPNRDGKSSDTGLLKEWPKGGPTKLWAVSGIGEGFSSPAVADGVIYVSGEENEQTKLTALDMRGGVKWSRVLCPAFLERRGNGPRATVTVDGDRLYFLTGKGNIFALNAANGKTIWERNMGDFGGRTPTWGYSESVLLYDNLAIVTPGGPRFMVALDKATGETVWESQGVNDAVHYTSAITVEQDGVPMIVQGSRGAIFGVSPKDGSLLWKVDWPGKNTANCPTPAYEDGHVFWSIGYNKGAIGVKLAVEDGKVGAEQIYHTSDMVCHHGGYVVDEGYVYGNHGRGWTCLDVKTGETKWYEQGVGKGSVCYADGMLYTFSERGAECALVEVTPEGYREKGRVSVEGTGRFSWAHPIVANGRLYLRFGDKLHCFDVKK